MIHSVSKPFGNCIKIPATVFVLCKTGEKSVIIAPGPPSTFTVGHRPRPVLPGCLQELASLHEYHSENDILTAVKFDFGSTAGM